MDARVLERIKNYPLHFGFLHDKSLTCLFSGTSHPVMRWLQSSSPNGPSPRITSTAPLSAARYQGSSRRTRMRPWRPSTAPGEGLQGLAARLLAALRHREHPAGGGVGLRWAKYRCFSLLYTLLKGKHCAKSCEPLRSHCRNIL